MTTRTSILALALASAGFLAGLAWPRRAVDAAATRPAAVQRPELAQEEQATIGLFRRASPSVVFITSLARQRDFFSLDVQEIPQGSGSGFLWDEDGHVVTNLHVIQGASAAQVTRCRT